MSGSPEWTVFTIMRNERTLLRIVAGRCAALASVSLDQLADGRVIIAKFQALSAAARIGPKRFDDLRGDALCSSNLFCPGTPKYDSADSVNGGRPKSHMPIISAGGRTVQIELARCAPNRDE